MTALIIEWDPEGPEWSGTYASDVDAVRSAGLVRQRWTVPTGPALDHGMDVWLLVTGRRAAMQGLIGHGILAAIGSDTGAWASGEPFQCVEVHFDGLLPHGDQVPRARLVDRLPALGGAGFGALTVDAAAGTELRSLWAATVSPEPGSLDPIPGALPSAAVLRVAVNRFERDPQLRRVAVAHRGSACHACGMDFEQGYGAVAADLIQVHHITPLDLLDAGYEVDPLVDLIPLCPNCHVVAHSRWPEPLTVEEIKGRLRNSGFLRGSALTDEQLAAEAAAARILEA